jgi:hypothetical protein
LRFAQVFLAGETSFNPAISSAHPLILHSLGSLPAPSLHLSGLHCIIGLHRCTLNRSSERAMERAPSPKLAMERAPSPELAAGADDDIATEMEENREREEEHEGFLTSEVEVSYSHFTDGSRCTSKFCVVGQLLTRRSFLSN